MATLHLLSHSPFNDGRFESCLLLLGDDDGILLSGDATHALQPGSTPAQALLALSAGNALFALQEDLQARGLDDLPSRVVAVDYPGFVDLCTRFDKVNAWL
ncbi:tRNA 2-thiouridine synthesizing protein B [Pseudomonas nitritireducens]|uniref:tRNA 2-thiouridine synthesizing protein B n=1 Tax=Pseudomonas nitroreducens TaxID=46680 RepID=A0A7W7KL53_PSENT|nr:sulfurtransferase complex subunit TusB [Pseudomonas nitritireducens]MBB4864820.1 tRNA 2-thiouridine synthesizing protein B [Pseudomonas nitritireducens]